MSSKWRQVWTYWMPDNFSSPTLWWCPNREYAVHQYWGRISEMEQTSSMRATSWASYAQLDLYGFLKLLDILTKSLCCHFNFSLTYGIICLNACGYYTYYFNSMSINSQSFNNKLSIFHLPSAAAVVSISLLSISTVNASTRPAFPSGLILTPEVAIL